MRARPFLAVDWGTTNRRVYRMDAAGAVVETARDDRGALAIPQAAWGAEIAALRARFGDLPIIAAGMIGSTRGWREVPYVACPAGLADLAAQLAWVEPGRTAIVPGVVDRGAPDVMRGEEVQLLGAVAAGLVPGDALLCQPGTHCKWATMREGRITRFRTAMTGELFAMLRERSLLSDYMEGPVAPGADFAAGLALARERQVLTGLFQQRATAVLDPAARAATAARTSGLLIGSDVLEQRLAPGQTVYVLADEALGALYGAAIAACGGSVVSVDSHAAFVAGMTTLGRAIA